MQCNRVEELTEMKVKLNSLIDSIESSELLKCDIAELKKDIEFLKVDLQEIKDDNKKNKNKKLSQYEGIKYVIYGAVITQIVIFLISQLLK